MGELIYNLDDFEKIKQQGFDYELPNKTIQIINKIAKLVGSPDYIKTPIFKRNNYDNKQSKQHNKYNKRKRKQVKELSDEEWEMLRKFEKTKLQKHKDNFEKELNKLRTLLNKLTDKTIDSIKDEFFEKMDNLLNELNEIDLIRLVESIFEIASSNQFYSAIYAQLIKELIEKYDVFYSVFETMYNNSIERLMNTLKYKMNKREKNNNYNELCKNNLENDKRKSISKFLANLVKEDIIESHDYIIHINELIELFLDNMKEKNKNELNESISDILYEILITCCEKLYQDNDTETEELISKIIDITETKPNSKSNPSLSNKSLFKLMDIIDYLEENNIIDID